MNELGSRVPMCAPASAPAEALIVEEESQLRMLRLCQITATLFSRGPIRRMMMMIGHNINTTWVRSSSKHSLLLFLLLVFVSSMLYT